MASGQQSFLPTAESSSSLPPWQPVQGALAPQEQWQLLADRRDRLRNELKRGKEYLRQVQKDLSESRSLLEAWPTYERHCGKNPLPDLIQSVASKERIVQFLTDWLKRREEKLDTVAGQLRMCADPKDAKVFQPPFQPPEPQV
ncbi:MAG TPA: hypothetical protein VNT26_23790 [Candidatus Sulfotelmatobacter sp.]|nr:hypothetical protein [Candidatus Sulfotelmatobacter sp.]